MKVISVPARLRLGVLGLLLVVPLVAVEAMIALRAPWWRPPTKILGIWSLAITLIFLPIGGWILAGKRWTIGLVTVFATFWCVLSAWIAIHTKNTTLGFFSIFLAFYFTVLVSFLKREITRSFLDPQLSWYQGVPKPIPGLFCEIALGDKKAGWRVGRIDQEGAFLFTGTKTAGLSLKKGSAADLKFRFRDLVVQCQGKPMSEMEDGRGAGFQFARLDPDGKKELGDFVEALRGEGYVP